MPSVAFLRVRDAMLDRKKVEAAASADGRKRLMRFGAFVRQRARTSIKKGPKVSRPGGPPAGHTQELRNRIMFAVEGATVFIGPERLNKPGLAPRTLEEGGTARLNAGGRALLLRYRARPFMRPAFEEELKRLPNTWAGMTK